MHNPKSLIAAMGGPSRLSEALCRKSGRSISAAAVSHWGKVSRVPAWWLGTIVELAQEQGIEITAVSILAASAAPKPRKPYGSNFLEPMTGKEGMPEKFEANCTEAHPLAPL